MNGFGEKPLAILTATIMFGGIIGGFIRSWEMGREFGKLEVIKTGKEK